MAAPLSLTIAGYGATVTRNADDSVTIAVDVGWPIGTPSFTVPADEWDEIVDYTTNQAPQGGGS
jgi:hypothetical protein